MVPVDSIIVPLVSPTASAALVTRFITIWRTWELSPLNKAGFNVELNRTNAFYESANSTIPIISVTISDISITCIFISLCPT